MSARPEALDAALAAHGLLRLATVALEPGEIAPPAGRAAPRSATIVGNAGSAMWEAFRAQRGAEASLDAWTRAVIEPIAARVGAFAAYPFDGPPVLPIQRLALRSRAFHRSPLGLTIHAEYGLWHAFRAALCFADEPVAAAAASAHPCETCAARPCLTACPVDAFRPSAYDVAACRDHLAPDDVACFRLGCAARRACPVGLAWRYVPAHAEFHMRAFRDAASVSGSRRASTPSCAR